MDLASVARPLNWLRSPERDPRLAEWVLPIAWAILLTLLITGPWFAPGYLFGTDWPGPRHLDFPTEISSSFLLRVALAASSWIVSGEATGKLLIIGSVLTASVTAYRAVPIGGFVPRAAASIVYVVNPFVYGRLHYGQVFLIAALAVLPWVLIRFRRLLLEPEIANALLSAVSLALLGVLDLHLLLVASALTGSLAVTHVIRSHNKRSYVKRVSLALVLTGAVTIGASAYWLIPLLRGSGTEGATLSGIGTGDLLAFATVPDQHLGLLTNVLGLYGFWAENSGRFTSMKAFVPLWPAVLAMILLVCLAGAIFAFTNRRDGLAPWATGLLVAGVIAVVLDAGISLQVSARLVGWLDANLPLYRGMRDAGKWAALLALVYSQLFGLGAASILERLRRQKLRKPDAEWFSAIGASLLLAVPLYMGNGLLFGMHGEIKPSAYPASWYEADRTLSSDHHPGRTLFLPWHEYMSYSFVLNQNRVVAPPAPGFFSVPVLVSTDPEVPGVVPPPSADHDAITALVQAGGAGQWAEVLNANHIKYVLLARELDWAYFKFLDDQPGLTRVGDFGSIILYRNELAS